LTKDFILRYKFDKLDISWQGFLPEPTTFGQVPLTFMITQFFTSIVRETFKARYKAGFPLPVSPYFQWGF
jgi:hypothetical protein